MTKERKSGADGWAMVAIGAFVVILVVGFVVYQNLPTIVTGGGADGNLAITRAEAINLATAAFVQSRGLQNAVDEWDSLGGNQAKYERLYPFLAFAPARFEEFMPRGYSVEMLEDLRSFEKVTLRNRGGVLSY